MMRRFCTTIILLCILTGLTGCGATEPAWAEEIELLEPVGINVTTEAVAYRDLFGADLYLTDVIPYTVEYAFSKNVEVEKFNALPGEAVKAGEILVCANTEDIDADIEEMEEKIAAFEEEHQDFGQTVTEELEKSQGRVERLAGILDDIEKILAKTQQYITGNEGTVIENPDYIYWQKEYVKYEGEYHIQAHEITMQEAKLRQRTEIYELDHAYYMEKLKKLQDERQQYFLRSEIAGEVVAIGKTDYTIYNAKADEAVVAVGDRSRKIVKCQYISESEAAKADEIYALINGKKYELLYHPMDREEYKRLLEGGETVYTTFEIVDADEVQIGDYAALAIVKDKREQVLTVLKDAIQGGSGAFYVYVIENGESVRRDIKIGFSDGVYTEVLSGLEEGELVKVQEPLSYGDRKAVVQRSSISDSIKRKGSMYYPNVTQVENPVTYGTVFYVETNVELNQQVEKGDVIAAITVEGDDILIQEKRLKLQRLEERLQDLVDEGDPEKNQETIVEKQEEIAELKELLNQMEQDAVTTKIKAPRSGIVVHLEDFKEDEILEKGCVVAQIADEDTYYIMAENPRQLLNYGNEVTIEYEDAQGQECVTMGTVATLSNVGISAGLVSESTLIMLPEESDGGESANNINNIDKGVSYPYAITAKIKKMDNVLVVPKGAVTTVSGVTYVHIIDEDGKIKAQSFIAGGNDKENYWVVDGLTEGMEVCLE